MFNNLRIFNCKNIIDYSDKITLAIKNNSYSGRKFIKKIGFDLTKEEIDKINFSIECYTSTRYEDLRDYLQYGAINISDFFRIKEFKKELDELIIYLDKAIQIYASGIDYYGIDRSIKTKRRICIPSYLKEELIEKWLKDGYILDKSFMSTSLTGNYNKKGNKEPNEFLLDLDINLESLKNGIYLRNLSRLPFEDEFLVKRESMLYFDNKDLIIDKDNIKIKGLIK